MSVLWCAIGALGMILGAVYLLTLVQKVFWGADLVPENRALTDINGWELAGALPMIALVVILGVFPAPLLTLIGPSVDAVVQLLRVGGMP